MVSAALLAMEFVGIRSVPEGYRLQTRRIAGPAYEFLGARAPIEPTKVMLSAAIGTSKARMHRAPIDERIKGVVPFSDGVVILVLLNLIAVEARLVFCRLIESHAIISCSSSF